MKREAGASTDDNSGAAPATVSERRWISTPLRSAREGDSPGDYPLASPETGLEASGKCRGGRYRQAGNPSSVALPPQL